MDSSEFERMSESDKAAVLLAALWKIADDVEIIGARFRRRLNASGRVKSLGGHARANDHDNESARELGQIEHVIKEADRVVCGLQVVIASLASIYEVPESSGSGAEANVENAKAQEKNLAICLSAVEALRKRAIDLAQTTAAFRNGEGIAAEVIHRAMKES